jgi:hypothetical protein
MQPKATVVTFNPVRPRVRKLNPTGPRLAASEAARFGEDVGMARPAAGSASPVARKLRREEFTFTSGNLRV